MRAFVCEVDHAGLREFLPEEAVMRGVPCPRLRTPHPTTVVWALLTKHDAEAIRMEVVANRPRDACGLLLNRAVELISLAAAASRPAQRPASIPAAPPAGAPAS